MGHRVELQIEAALTATDEVRELIGELEAVLAAEYPPEQRHGLSLDAIFQPHVRFFLARLGRAAVGGGGVALFREYAEVKRMYVRDSARGQGVADAILARIEAEVRSAGLSLLRLETGVRQIAAMRFYARAGFRECSAITDRWRHKPLRPVSFSRSDWIAGIARPPLHPTNVIDRETTAGWCVAASAPTNQASQAHSEKMQCALSWP